MTSLGIEERLRRLEERVTLVERENKALKRSWNAALTALGEQSALEYSLQKQARELNAVREGNPSLAIELLEREGCSLYMQCCTTPESKRELWRLACESSDVDVTLGVSLFLYATMNDTEFGQLVMSHAFVSSQFLRHWRKQNDQEQYELICVRYERWPEYIKSRFKRAIAVRDRDFRHCALEACLLMARSHPSEEMDWLELRITDALDASRKQPALEQYPQNVNAKTSQSHA